MFVCDHGQEVEKRQTVETYANDTNNNKNQNNMKNGKIWKNIKNTNWKLIWIDNTIVKLEKKILCKLQTTSNGDPIEIAANFNVILMHDKIKENFTLSKKKINCMNTWAIYDLIIFYQLSISNCNVNKISNVLHIYNMIKMHILFWFFLRV